MPSPVASPTAACSYPPGEDKWQPRRSFPYAALEEAKKLEKCPIGNHGNNKNGRTPGAVRQLWLVIAFTDGAAWATKKVC